MTDEALRSTLVLLAAKRLHIISVECGVSVDFHSQGPYQNLIRWKRSGSTLLFWQYLITPNRSRAANECHEVFNHLFSRLLHDGGVIDLL